MRRVEPTDMYVMKIYREGQRKIDVRRTCVIPVSSVQNSVSRG